MSELAKCLGFYLTDPFTCYVEFPAHFFKCARASVIETESQYQYLLFSFAQSIEHFTELFLEHRVCRGIDRRRNVLVRNEISEMAVFLLSDRRLK